MKKKLFQILLYSLVMILLPSVLWANIDGLGTKDRTGAPGKLTCTDCHGGTENTGGGYYRLMGLPSTYKANSTYSLTLQIGQVGQARWGFQIKASHGLISVTDATHTYLSNTTFLNHNSAGTYAGQTNAAQWSFNWTAPDTTFSNVTFYTAGNASNNDGDETVGDYIYNFASTANLFINTAPPDPGFFANTTVGTSPLNVNFTDTSGNTPTGWSWSFGDGSTSNLQNPSHIFTTIGTSTSYTVQLIVSNSFGTTTAIHSNYIVVNPPPPNIGFFGSPLSGQGPLQVNFTDTSANNPTSWAWNFGDGGTDTIQNPGHIYPALLIDTAYTVQLIASNAYGTSTMTKVNYVSVTLNNNIPPDLVKLPDLKLYIGQVFAPAFSLADFNSGGNATTYSIVTNFLALTSLNGSTVNQDSYSSATVGTVTYQATNGIGSSVASNKVKYSTYKIHKLPKIGLNAGSSSSINLAPYTYDSSGQAIPLSYGNAAAVESNNPTNISVSWTNVSTILITAANTFTTGPKVSVHIIAAANANQPFGVNIDKEEIAVYPNLLHNSTFSTAQDTSIYSPLETAPGRATLATQSWVSTFTDPAGTQANGVWKFTFPSGSAGIKGTPSVANWINIVNSEWYIIRMRIVADSANTHQSVLFGYTNFVGSGIQTDIGANVIFGIPTTWTWQETPVLAHGNTTTGYPQFQFKASGAGSVYVDEIQIINAKPTLVDADRYITQIKYPYGGFEQASDTTGWGQEIYTGAGSTPAISVSNSSLWLDFSGASTGTNQKGIKWTANNKAAGAATFLATPGREVGVRAKITKQSGSFDSLGIVVVSAFGVQTSGQQTIGVGPSNILAAAGVGIIPGGDYRTVANAVNGYYQFQFGIRSNQAGVLRVSQVDFERDQDDPNYGDGSLFP